MGIGKTSDNYTFYEGYEGEPEIILIIPNEDILHIWEGYFDDIYDTPSLDGNGWKGFTRDYHQMEGIFADDNTGTEMLGFFRLLHFLYSSLSCCEASDRNTEW